MYHDINKKIHMDVCRNIMYYFLHFPFEILRRLKRYYKLTKKIWGKHLKTLDGKITSKYGTSRLCRVKSSIYYLVLSDVVLNIRCTSDLGGWRKRAPAADVQRAKRSIRASGRARCPRVPYNRGGEEQSRCSRSVQAEIKAFTGK